MVLVFALALRLGFKCIDESFMKSISTIVSDQELKFNLALLQASCCLGASTRLEVSSST